MKTLIGLYLSTVIIAVSGVFHGWLTNRWSEPAQLDVAGAELVAMPEQVGEWKLLGSHEVSPGVVNLLQCAGYIHRTYENEQTGERVNIAVFLGPPGPIAVHTPEVCYPSQDFEPIGSRERVTIGDSENSDQARDQFWRSTFRSNSLDAETLRVFYGWSDGGPWRADESPRISHAAKTHLYKLQLTATLPQDQERSDVGERFLAAFLPVVNQHLTVNASR